MPRALAEMTEILDWIEDHLGTDRAAECFACWNEAIGTLATYPSRGAVDGRASTKGKEVRKLLLLDLGLDYAVYYRVKAGVVEIWHVRHCSRRPPRKGSIPK